MNIFLQDILHITLSVYGIFNFVYYYSRKDQVIIMAFKVEREEYVNKTFRIEKKLIDELEVICNKKNISLNKLDVKCIRYALENLDDDEN